VEVVVFGDSLSETGNFSLVTGGALPPAPLYYNGRFLNGPAWVEHFAKAIGEPAPLPSLTGGSNYAFNGARAAGVSPYGTPDLGAHVDSFLLASGGVANADDVFVIWAGANDIFFGATTGETNFIPGAINGISDAMLELYAAGAKNIVVLNRPLLGQTPFFKSNPAIAGQLDAATTAFNASLASRLATLDATLPDVLITDVKISSLFEQIKRRPQLFLLKNVVDSATLFDPVTGIGYALVPKVDPNRYLFWDSVHPTARGHKIIALYATIDLLFNCAN